MKLPNSKIYWADYLSYSALLTDSEVCQVMKIIGMRAMSYENPQDNLSDNPQDNPQVSIQKQIQIHIQKLNQIQLDFYKCMEKAQDESARDYIASITNGKKGGRPRKEQQNEDPQVLVDVDSGKLDISEEAESCLSHMSDTQYVKTINWIRENLNGKTTRKSSLSKAIMSFAKEESNG